MCSIRWIHKEFKLRYNKIDSNHKRDLPPAFIDDIANESLIDYVEIPFSANKAKKYKIPFDATQQKRDMLRTLIEPITIDTRTGTECNTWLARLPDDYFHPVRSYYADEDCDECKPYNIEVVQYDDLNSILTDDYRKPSKRWRRLVATVKQEDIVIHTDGLIQPLEIFLEYIRCPAKVFIGGYDTLDYIEGDQNAPSASSTPIDPDIPDKYCSFLVDLMVQNASRPLYDPQQVSLREDKIINVLQ